MENHNLSLIKALVTTLHLEVEALPETLGDESDDSLDSLDLNEKMREYETKLIKTAMIKAGGNQRKAAEILNIKRSTLNSKLKNYSMRPKRGDYLTAAMAAA